MLSHDHNERRGEFEGNREGSPSSCHAAFLESGIGTEIERGFFVLRPEPFFFASGILHFPDSEARAAIKLGNRWGAAGHTEQEERGISEVAGAYLSRFGHAFRANKVGRRPVMLTQPLTTHQRGLLSISPAFTVFPEGSEVISNALAHALQPWNLIVSESLASRNRLARSELAWLEFVRSVAMPSDPLSCAQQGLLREGFALVATHWQAKGNAPEVMMRWVGLDTSLFSQLSLWYFYAAPRELPFTSSSGAAGELSRDHAKRALYFGSALRDAATFHKDKAGCDVLRHCCALAEQRYEKALGTVSRFIAKFESR